MNNNISPSITCGCGFVIQGTDEARNAEVFESHTCVLESTDREYQWHDSVFSFWGAAIAFILVLGVVSVVTGQVDW
jgi:hypothetical protein